MPDWLEEGGGEGTASWCLRLEGVGQVPAQSRGLRAREVTQERRYIGSFQI